MAADAISQHQYHDISPTILFVGPRRRYPPPAAGPLLARLRGMPAPATPPPAEGPGRRRTPRIPPPARTPCIRTGTPPRCASAAPPPRCANGPTALPGPSAL